MKKVIIGLIIIACLFCFSVSHAATPIISGATTDLLSIGATSKGAYVELSDSNGKLGGATKAPHVFFIDNYAGTTTETMLTLGYIDNYVVGATATSFIVPNGKTLALLGFQTFIRPTAGTATQYLKATLRVNPIGAVVNTSPPLLWSACSSAFSGTTTIGCTGSQMGMSSLGTTFPSLLEIKGDGTLQIGISQISSGQIGNFTILYGYEY